MKTLTANQSTGAMREIVTWLYKNIWSHSADEVAEPTPYTSGKLEFANVAQTLVEYLTPHIDSDPANTVLTIVGNRGDYSALVSQRDSIPLTEELWFSALRDWSKRGTSIDYILMSASLDSAQALVTLQNESENFHVWPITPDCVPNAVDKAYVRQLETFHPVLLENKFNKKRAMWIENNHPIGTPIANNIDWVAPGDTRYDKRFDDISDFLRGLISIAGTTKNEKKPGTKSDQHLSRS